MSIQEDVKIVVSAEDRASKILHGIAGSMNETSNTTKKLGGVLADVFNRTGSTFLAGMANEVRNMSDAIGDATDRMDKGRIGAIGMKVAIAGIAGAAGYQLGEQINSWVLGAAKFRAEMEAAGQAAKDLQNSLMKQSGRILREDLERIGLMPEEVQQQAYASRIEAINKMIAAEEKELERFRNREQEIARQLPVRLGIDKDSLPNARQNSTSQQRKIDDLKAQRDQIAALTSDHAREMQAIRKKQAEEKAGLETIRSLKDQIEKTKDPKRFEREKALSKAANQEQRGQILWLLAEQEKLEASQERQRMNAESQREAARKHALNEKAIQGMARQMQKQSMEPIPFLEPTESRVLRSGPWQRFQSKADEAQARIANAVEKDLEVNQQILRHLERHGSRAPVVIGVTGGGG